MFLRSSLAGLRCNQIIAQSDREIDAIFTTDRVAQCIGRYNPQITRRSFPHCCKTAVLISHRIGLDFSPISISYYLPRQTKNTSTLYHPSCGSQFGTENWYRKLMRGFKFVPIWSYLMLIFLTGNRPLYTLTSRIKTRPVGLIGR